MAKIVELLHKLSYEPDFQPVSREDLAKKYNGRYGTNLPLDFFSDCQKLADKIIASDHTRKRKAMMFFIASIPLIDRHFIKKLKEIAKYKLDQERRLVVFSLREDRRTLFQTRREYTLSVETFCSNFFKSFNTPMSAEDLYEQFMKSGHAYGSFETFTSTCANVVMNILDADVSMEMKAKFFFVTGFELPDWLLAEWKKSAVVEVDQFNRITKFQSKFASFKKPEKRRMDKDGETEPAAKRGTDTTVSLGTTQSSEVPLVYRPSDSTIPPSQGSQLTSTVPRMTPPITPLASEQSTVEKELPKMIDEDAQMGTAKEPTLKESKTEVSKVTQKTKNNENAKNAPLKINDEPKDSEHQEPEAHQPEVQKKNPVIVKKKIAEVAPTEQVPENVKREPEDPVVDAPDAPLAQPVQVIIKTEPLDPKDDSPITSTAYTVLKEFYFLLSDVLIKFGNGNFRTFDEKWKKLLRTLKEKNDESALTCQEVINQFLMCVDRRLVGSPPGSPNEISVFRFMYNLEKGMNKTTFEDAGANKLWGEVFWQKGEKVESQSHEVFRFADIDICFSKIATLLLFICE